MPRQRARPELLFIFIILVMPSTIEPSSDLWNKTEVETNLKRIVSVLSEEIGPRSFIDRENLRKASDFISESFKSYGYKVSFQDYQVEDLKARNIIAEKKGNEGSKRVIIIGAHYDTVIGTPGADDNASGMAVLLELSRLLAKNTFKTRVQFVAFTLEEIPFYKTGRMGSRVYARALKERGEEVVGMICLESVGYYSNKEKSQNFPYFFFRWLYPDKGNFITVVGNIKSRNLAKRIAMILKKNPSLPVETFIGPTFVPGVNWSDHHSFWQEGYQAVMLTGTAFYRNPNYHLGSDRPETLDYSSMAELVKGLTYALSDLNPFDH